jgi:hypothetical protein
MSDEQNSIDTRASGSERRSLDSRLAAYTAAASGTLVASEAQAIIVSNSTVQPFGINGEVGIDFNADGQLEWQIDHDRVNLNGNLLDYLQIDKNDINSETNPLPVDPLVDLAYQNFPLNGTNRNNDAAVLSFTNDLNDLGGYPVALKAGVEIGGSADNPTGSFVPGTNWDWQEGSNFLGGGTYIRANRLIDEDMGQIDTNAGNPVTIPNGPQPEYPELEDFLGLGGEVRYLGVRVDLNDAAFPGLNDGNNPDFHQQNWYGWIGIRITNEADATGEVVGWGYETEMGKSILAGATGKAAVAGDYNGNGTVDAADYVVWRENNGLTSGATAAQGDGNGDGMVNSADYSLWRANFGASGSGSVAALESLAAVPEPSSLFLGLGMAAALVIAFFQRRRRDC